MSIALGQLGSEFLISAQNYEQSSFLEIQLIQKGSLKEVARRRYWLKGYSTAYFSVGKSGV